MYLAKVDKLAHGKHSPDDPVMVGRACFTAGIIYMVLLVFCVGQVFGLIELVD